jgi:hypothetical protein
LLVAAESAPAAKATRALSVCSLDGEGLGKVVGWEDSQNLQSQWKKEEFPGVMENMLPGNSFPQICVVSVHIML